METKRRPSVDHIVHVCGILQEDLPRAKRALCAARRSGRDVRFNAYIGMKRIQMETVKAMDRLLACVNPRG